MPKYTPVAFEINVGPDGLVFDVGSLFEALLALHDQRDARGIRYALVTVLVYVVLAKLAGEDYLRGIAQWVAERQEGWAELLGLAKPQAPATPRMDEFGDVRWRWTNSTTWWAAFLRGCPERGAPSR